MPKYEITQAKAYFLANRKGVMIEWIGPGFGSIVIFNEGGKLVIDSEHMSKEFVMAVLEKLVDEALWKE